MERGRAFLFAVARARATKKKPTFSSPPVNHFMLPFGKSASSTRSHRLRQEKVDAMGPQKPAGSASDCACSFEYSAREDTCAVEESHAGGGIEEGGVENARRRTRAISFVRLGVLLAV